MNISFDILFRIMIDHSYFKENPVRDLEIIPTETSARMLINAGLIWRQTSGGLIVLYEKDPTEEEPHDIPWKLKNEPFKLAFYIIAKSSLFYNYSDIPDSIKLPEVFYWNNREKNDQDGKLLLNKGTKVSSDDLVSLREKLLTITGTSSNPSETFMMKDIDGNILINRSIKVKKQKETDTEGVYFTQVDLAGPDEGRYQLEYAGKTEEIYVAGSWTPDRLLGIVEIFNGTEVAVDNRFMNGTNVSAKNYHLVFNARETFWKYYIVLRNISEDPGLQVIYQESTQEDLPYPDEVEFKSEPPEEQRTETFKDNIVLLFQSQKTIPFYEIARKGISLQDTSSSGSGGGGPGRGRGRGGDADDPGMDKDVIKNLPNAPVSAIKPNSDDGKIYSEIFIYV